EQSIVQQNALAAQLENAKAEMEKQLLEKEVVVSQLAIETASVQADKEKYIAQKAEAESQVAEYTAAQEAAELAVLASYEAAETEEPIVDETSETEEVVVAESSESAEEPQVVEESEVVASTPTETTKKTENAPTTTKAPAKTPAKTETKAPAKTPVAPKPTTPAPSTSGGTSWSKLQPHATSVMGTPYLWGGTTTNGFDCSGFTSYVFAKIGISLPRTAAAQYASSTKVSNPQPGDLVFFSSGGSITHVGIYVGNGQFIGSQSSTGVAYTSVSSSYWGPKLVGYGRY
ncbi:MAG: NlpC/P60 family protein, partial [Carnobacterium jeotgali]